VVFVFAKPQLERRDGDMKKYFLTTALMGTFIAPAFGADKIITSANTCTVDVLGVSDNNAVANTIATWDLIDYTLNPGQYLSVTETSVDKTTCPAGSYCVGGGYTVETADNSIAQCPTGYPNSANGASADTQCYTACTLASANIAHATAVTGNDYYGTGTDTCEPTACMAGWHVKPGLDIGATIGEEAGSNSAYINNTGSFSEMNYDGKGSKGQEYYGISDKMSFAVDYAGKGILTGRASCQPKADPAMEYFWNNVNSIDGDISREEFYAGLVSAGGTTKADILMDYYEAGWVGGVSDEEIALAYKNYYATFVEKDTNYSTDSVGQYCYCQVDGFTPVGGTKAIVTSAPWVFRHDCGSADSCAASCAYRCASDLRFDDAYALAFRGAVMNNLPALPATCAANTINIDWNPDNGGEHTVNQCTYEGTVTLPTPDPVKPGYTFTGWKLVDGTTTE
jgi:hypothetical protein